MALWLLLACGLGAQQFREEANQHICTNLQRCAAGAFLMEYGTVAACVEARARSYALLYRCEQVACAFDVEAAETCIEHLDAATCAEVVDGSAWEGCAEVFVGCDEARYEECVDAG